MLLKREGVTGDSPLVAVDLALQAKRLVVGLQSLEMGRP